MLEMAHGLGGNMDPEQTRADVVRVLPFSSDRKRMSTIVELGGSRSDKFRSNSALHQQCCSVWRMACRLVLFPEALHCCMYVKPAIYVPVADVAKTCLIGA